MFLSRFSIICLIGHWSWKIYINCPSLKPLPCSFPPGLSFPFSPGPSPTVFPRPIPHSLFSFIHLPVSQPSQLICIFVNCHGFASLASTYTTPSAQNSVLTRCPHNLTLLSPVEIQTHLPSKVSKKR